MAAEQVLMQDVDVDVNTGTVEAPAWTHVGGVTGTSHKPSTNRVDTKNNDSGGREEHMVTRRGDTFNVKAQRLEDASTGDRDAGQEAIEVSARAVGSAAKKQYRLTSPGGNTLIFLATAQVTEFDGCTDDVANWEAELVVTGDITRA
jgi:hypothetical protein